MKGIRHRLVTRQDALQHEPGIAPVHPTFAHPGFGLDAATPASERPRLARYLSCRVSRQPHDLLAHTRRILLMREQRDAEGCYAALLDLFFILDGRGSAIRGRLLRQCGDMLDGAQKSQLQGQLRSGRTDLEPAALNRRCQLARSGHGLRLVRRAEHQEVSAP